MEPGEIELESIEGRMSKLESKIKIICNWLNENYGIEIPEDILNGHRERDFESAGQSGSSSRPQFTDSDDDEESEEEFLPFKCVQVEITQNNNSHEEHKSLTNAINRNVYPPPRPNYSQTLPKRPQVKPQPPSTYKSSSNSTNYTVKPFPNKPQPPSRPFNNVNLVQAPSKLPNIVSSAQAMSKLKSDSTDSSTTDDDDDYKPPHSLITPGDRARRKSLKNSKHFKVTPKVIPKPGPTKTIQKEKQPFPSTIDPSSLPLCRPKPTDRINNTIRHIEKPPSPPPRAPSPPPSIRRIRGKFNCSNCGNSYAGSDDFLYESSKINLEGRCWPFQCYFCPNIFYIKCFGPQSLGENPVIQPIDELSYLSFFPQANLFYQRSNTIHYRPFQNVNTNMFDDIDEFCNNVAIPDVSPDDELLNNPDFTEQLNRIMCVGLENQDSLPKPGNNVKNKEKEALEPGEIKVEGVISIGTDDSDLDSPQKKLSSPTSSSTTASPPPKRVGALSETEKLTLKCRNCFRKFKELAGLRTHKRNCRDENYSPPKKKPGRPAKKMKEEEAEEAAGEGEQDQSEKEEESEEEVKSYSFRKRKRPSDSIK